MKTILLAAPNSYVIRNWIAGGLADACAEHLELSPVLLSPFRESEFLSPGGRKIPNLFANPAPSHGFRRLLALRANVFAQEVPAASSQMVRTAQRRDKYHYGARVLRRLFPRFSRRRLFARRLLEAITPRFPEIASHLNHIRPALTVSGTTGVYTVDLAVLGEARRLGIPRLCVVNSWDNMTTRGSMILRPERLAVWNPEMRSTAARLHEYPESLTAVVGALQMVPYAEPPTPDEVVRLHRRLGLRQGQAYLLYVSSQLFQEYEVEEVRLLSETLTRSRFARWPLVVRLHPQSNRERFLGVPGLTFDQAPAFSQQDRGGLSFGLKEIRHLATLLSRAKVVFSTIATTAVLEAAVWDRPAVQLQWTDIPRSCSTDQVAGVRWSRQYPHIRFFNEFGATRFSKSPDDLEQTIEASLDNPELQAARRKAVEAIVTPPLSAPPGRIVRLIRDWLPI